MNNKRHITTTALALSLLLIFKGTIHAQTVEMQNKIKVSVQAGLSSGGIVESMDIDGFSGATKAGVNGGIHISKHFSFGEMETGIDYLNSRQTFTYSDDVNHFVGERIISLNQMMIPFTYNIPLFRSLLSNTELQLKVGGVGQLNFLPMTESGSLPDYTFKRFSGGITIGMSAYPFTLGDKYKLGFYADLYKGSQIYKDLYNEHTTSSFFRAGMRFRFR